MSHTNIKCRVSTLGKTQVEQSYSEVLGRRRDRQNKDNFSPTIIIIDAGIGRRQVK